MEMVNDALGLPFATHHGDMGDPFRGTEWLVGAGVELGHDGPAEWMFCKMQGHDGGHPCCDA
jgi:hypothetical protein